MYQTVTRRGIKDTASAISYTIDLIRNSDEYAGLPFHLRGFLDNQLFGPGQIDSQTPASALEARRLSAQVFQSVAQLHFNDLLGRNPEPYLATFSFRNGEVGLGQRLRHVQTSFFEIEAAVASFGLEGVIVPDIDILLPRSGAEPIIALHYHAAVVPGPGRKVRLKSTAEKMARMIGRESRLPVAVKLGGKRDGDLRLHAENICTYASKFTAAPKEPFFKDGEIKWRPNRALYTPQFALGAMYAWSQIPLLGSVQPVGLFGESVHECWLNKMQRASNVGTHAFGYCEAETSDYWQDIVERVGL